MILNIIMHLRCFFLSSGLIQHFRPYNILALSALLTDFISINLLHFFTHYIAITRSVSTDIITEPLNLFYVIFIGTSDESTVLSNLVSPYFLTNVSLNTSEHTVILLKRLYNFIYIKFFFPFRHWKHLQKLFPEKFFCRTYRLLLKWF